jgi:hypothetical protein
VEVSIGQSSRGPDGGYIVLAIAGQGVWSAAVAGGLALGVMLAARVGHSPAAATAIIVAATAPPWPRSLRYSPSPR